MKTILEIAKEIGVSKQAVYKRYKGKLYTKVLPYVQINEGTTYISEQGEDIIKRDFSKDDNISDGVSHMDTLVSMLQKELGLKNKQIEELTEIIKTQAVSISAAHHNELAETIIPKLEGEKKKGFFHKFFRG